MRKPASHRGFTLIEIILVMAIIGILASAFFGNFFTAFSKARDSRRKADLKSIQEAMQLYFTDQNPPSYPDDGFMAGLCGQCWSSGADCSGNIYLRKLPCDMDGNDTYLYTRDPSDNLKYTLVACLENDLDPNRDETANTYCSGAGKESYTVYEP